MLERRLALEAAARRTPTIGVISAFLALAYLTAFLRFYTRLVIVRAFYSEDWLMASTLILFTGYCIGAIVLSALVTQGLGVLLSFDDALKALKLVLIVESFYIWTMLILKFAVGIFYIRISLDRRLRIIVWASMITSTIAGISLFLVTLLQCGVFKDMFIYGVKKLSGQCMASSSYAAVSYVHAAVNTLTDFVFVIMPVFILHKAAMPIREKVIAGGLLMLASASGIAAIVRFTFINAISAPTNTFFVTCTGVTIWSCIEPGIGIIAGSITCLRPLLRKHLGQLYGLSSRIAHKQDLNEEDGIALKDLQSRSGKKSPGIPKTWYNAKNTTVGSDHGMERAPTPPAKDPQYT